MLIDRDGDFFYRTEKKYVYNVIFFRIRNNLEYNFVDYSFLEKKHILELFILKVNDED